MTTVKKALTGGLITVSCLALLYCITAFTEVPILSTARNIWIETAMTTADHQWLATKLFPKTVIDKVMARQVNEIEGIAGLDENMQEPIPTTPDEEVIEIDILGQKDLVVGKPDRNGNEVIVNDIEQGIVISKIVTTSYTAHLVQIDDSSRVFIADTDKKGSIGKLICDYLEDENAIVGVNASGFYDPEGHGRGGDVIGRSRADGSEKDWGTYSPSYFTIGLTDGNRLIAGKIKDWDEYNLRCAFQFRPVLIQNGEDLMHDSAGWGVQPRTIVGQSDNGVFFILVVDGRQPGYSIGATMGDCASILLQYGCVTAAACDGGSSSVLAYNEELVNKPSTPMETGRYLPNAILVKKK